MIITIDGPASSGKGTLAKNLAKHYNLYHLDSGTIFRWIAQYIIDNPKQPTNSETFVTQLRSAIATADLTDPRIRSESIAQKASEISQIDMIRSLFQTLCLDKVNQGIKSYDGAVIDGRDAGTVLFPDADIKFYLVVDPEERARRRYLETQTIDQSTTYEDIYNSIVARDQRDMSRQNSPLKPANDAHILDLTSETPEEVLNMAIALIEAKDI
jgi:cytidylate kinase